MNDEILYRLMQLFVIGGPFIGYVIMKIYEAPYRKVREQDIFNYDFEKNPQNYSKRQISYIKRIRIDRDAHDYEWRNKRYFRARK